MPTIGLGFYECEHETDLARYAEDVARAGGKVMNSVVSYDTEEGTLSVEVESISAFKEAFKQTPSYEFSYLSQYDR